MNTENKESENQIEKKPQYPCLCPLVRKVGCSLTRKYGEALKTSGLKDVIDAVGMVMQEPKSNGWSLVRPLRDFSARIQ